MSTISGVPQALSFKQFHGGIRVYELGVIKKKRIGYPLEIKKNQNPNGLAQEEARKERSVEQGTQAIAPPDIEVSRRMPRVINVDKNAAYSKAKASLGEASCLLCPTFSLFLSSSVLFLLHPPLFFFPLLGSPSRFEELLPPYLAMSSSTASLRNSWATQPLIPGDVGMMW